MMKKDAAKYYPIFINLYSVWIVYMMFFAYNRDLVMPEIYEIRPFPGQSIRFLTQVADPMTFIKNVVGNIVLFIPYGFLGLMYPQLRRFSRLFFFFFLLMTVIEFSQFYFKRGFAELDDVLLNVLGMSIGFFFYKRLFLNQKTTD